MASFAADVPGPTPTPPAPPPKPGSHDASGISTPTVSGSGNSGPASRPASAIEGRPLPGAIEPPQASIPDPGPQWLPRILQDKSKQDIADILANPALLDALTQSPQTIHPSLQSSHAALQRALADNVDLASHMSDLETRLSRQRAATQAQLLSTHALERQWRQKQSGMDHALAPFAPANLYQRLSQGVQEQGGICQAMEDSFLEGEEEGSMATEREAGDWIRRYREARVRYYLRQERKERWDEGRVGGWR
ncbi:unnamed protein product [Clonostachys byssicola]|uniref:VPS37 C-terminal domain-containing protein n=1 Tax=Clonostachys byssicola TaxID=160290 RepID=A0A9N9UUV5_9HYPO|nr:unnamed protein product [Clonostachys byssicola]